LHVDTGRQGANIDAFGTLDDFFRFDPEEAQK
jgi:hypothetical protein